MIKRAFVALFFYFWDKGKGWVKGNKKVVPNWHNFFQIRRLQV